MKDLGNRTPCWADLVSLIIGNNLKEPIVMNYAPPIEIVVRSIQIHDSKSYRFTRQ